LLLFLKTDGRSYGRIFGNVASADLSLDIGDGRLTVSRRPLRRWPDHHHLVDDRPAD
jgi:hypothetical protein